MARRPAAFLCASLFAVSCAFAADPPPPGPPLTQPTRPQPTAFNTPPPKPVLSWDDLDRSYWIPAAEIVGFQFVLNRVDAATQPSNDYDVTMDTVRTNLHTRWVVDGDPFSINQFLHPIQGNIYFGLARSTGLGFGPALGYSLAGAALWEEAGEQTRPSINDEVASGIGGAFLGEPLFRMASLILENNHGWVQEIGAGILSPPLLLNRWAFGDRFDPVFRSHNPAVYSRLQLGSSLLGNSHGNDRELKEDPINGDVIMAYGLPGKPGYTYDRPFDYFSFQFTASTANSFENIFSRGLLVGAPYEAGDSYRGVWGLYGSYDYVAPQVFRVSTTAASLGTTGQWWLSRHVALQTTALAGVGYGAAGNVGGSGSQHDYHYGVTPQELAELRLLLSNWVCIETTARDYYVTASHAAQNQGAENIVRADVALTFRVYGMHGISVRYVLSERDAQYTGRPDRHQNVGVISVAYAYLGDSLFGAVDWRPAPERER